MNKIIYALKWIFVFIIFPVVSIIGFFGVLVLIEEYGTPIFNELFNLIF